MSVALDVVWEGVWIKGGLVGGRRSAVPSPFFRRAFVVEGVVAQAVLHVTALGLYECMLNGEVVGEGVLTPGWTDYAKRVYVQSYDVRSLLRGGENVLGAVLGDGWYCGHVATQGRQVYGDCPELLMQLEVVFEDGVRLVVGTDESWRVSYGPILESDLLMGEVYDARRELRGCSSRGYDESGWQGVLLGGVKGFVLEASPAPQMRRYEVFPSGEARCVSGEGGADRVDQYNFGQNLVGRLRIRVRARRGTLVRMVFGERLTPEGVLYNANYRSAGCTDYYTCRGGGGGGLGASFYVSWFSVC